MAPTVQTAQGGQKSGLGYGRSQSQTLCARSLAEPEGSARRSSRAFRTKYRVFAEGERPAAASTARVWRSRSANMAALQRRLSPTVFQSIKPHIHFYFPLLKALPPPSLTARESPEHT